MRKLLIPVVGALALMAPMTATADPATNETVRDEIVLNLTSEGWVATTSARVTVNFDIIQQKESTDELKTLVMSSLGKLAGKTNWHITSSRESKDRTGLVRWNIGAEARVDETQVSGLAARAETASRPGFKMRINYVDFSPSLKEYEALRGDLRRDIYGQALAEAGRLNEIFKSRHYVVSLVDFKGMTHRPAPTPRVMTMAKMSAESDMSNGNGPGNGSGNGAAELAVSRRLVQSATIILATPMDK